MKNRRTSLPAAISAAASVLLLVPLLVPLLLLLLLPGREGTWPCPSSIACKNMYSS
jgi:hypothetical protein